MRAFAKSSGESFRLLIRVPLQGINGGVLPSLPGGQLDLSRTTAMLPSVARWFLADKIDVSVEGLMLPKPRVAAVRISLPSDLAFQRFDSALEQTIGPALPGSTQLFRDQAMLDALLEYDLRSPAPNVGIRTRFAEWGAHVSTELQSISLEGARHFEYPGDVGWLYLRPSRMQTAWSFAATAFQQTLGNSGYLLLFFALALQQARAALVRFLGGFAIASSLVLGAASLFRIRPDALWFPVFLEVALASCVLYLVFEMIAGNEFVRRRSLLAAGFGAISGFSFANSFSAKQQFAGNHQITAALFYDAGAQAATVLAMASFFALLWVIFHATKSRRISARTETIVLSLLLGDLAWHRFTDHVEQLSQYRFTWPSFGNAATWITWFTALLAIAGAALLGVALRKRRASPR